METPILEQPEVIPQIQGAKSKKGRGWKILVLICLGIILIILIIAGVFFYRSKFVSLSGGGKAWKAVFLSNGQIYFGKITQETKDVLILRQIYYLQVQPQTQEGQTGQSQFTLVKLGEEIHGPTDEMRINKNHVVFIETLKPDSRVVQTIEMQKR